MPASDASNPDSSSGFVYYRYEPCLAAAAVFVSLFALASAVHLFQMIRTRTWFMIPFIIGAVLEAAGYVGRVLSATENPGPYTQLPFILQAVFLLIAPTFFAASIYMELGRIVLMVDGEAALFIRRTWLTKIFVTSDFIAFTIQSAGAAILASGGSNPDLGNTVIIVGLVSQIIAFGLFVVAAALFHFRMLKVPTQLAQERPWTKHMISLYVISMLIFIRSLVRVVEYVQGNAGTIMSHEVFIYIFDAVLMFSAVAVMNVIHPGEVARYVREMKKASPEVEKSGGRWSRLGRNGSGEALRDNIEMA